METTNTTPVKIRQANAADAHAVAQLATQLYTELELESYEGGDVAKIQPIAGDLLSLEKIVCFLAEDEDRAVGLITLHPCAAVYAGGEFGEISELYVTADYRSMRIGQRLLNAARAYAEKNGWKRLELGAPAGSRWDNTFSFYQDYGFVAIGPRLRLLIP